MTDDDRTRKPPDHRQAVGVCLHVATSNTTLLVSRADGEDLTPPDLSFVANAVRGAVVVALKQAARHVETFADILGQNIGEQATDAHDAARTEAVRAVGLEIDALAQRAGHQTIAFAEFEAIRVRLMDLGFALKPHHAPDVALAVAGQQSP